MYTALCTTATLLACCSTVLSEADIHFSRVSFLLPDLQHAETLVITVTHSAGPEAPPNLLQNCSQLMLLLATMKSLDKHRQFATAMTEARRLLGSLLLGL